MNTLTKFFTAASRFFHPATKTAADRTAPVGTMNWLSPSCGVARSWEEALGAHRGEGVRAIRRQHRGGAQWRGQLIAIRQRCANPFVPTRFVAACTLRPRLAGADDHSAVA